LKVIATLKYLEKIGGEAAHYGTQPGFGSPGQNNAELMSLPVLKDPLKRKKKKKVRSRRRRGSPDFLTPMRNS
tara:strand:- start:2248 stop:2466 length:219 start_codon:yes stop_codon:yes gene_type:complete